MKKIMIMNQLKSNMKNHVKNQIVKKQQIFRLCVIIKKLSIIIIITLSKIESRINKIEEEQ